MQLHTYGQYPPSWHGMVIEQQRLTERKPTCDSRYQNIIGPLDTMIELLRKKPDVNLARELDRLLDTIMEHIGLENSYMEMVAFPQAARHRLDHQILWVDTAGLAHRFDKRLDVLYGELVSIRVRWMDHISVHDRAFEAYLVC
ncbi:hypothetical protein FO488_05735 [Geobacter sp. FeAm09]|uniref:hypothetical protein n=1 Tax=Geobacter sp. FeAm09 TaxID=2597769 RepID=UPI0011ED3EC9|nr:hypothetical protein [Geobacter sp. FeAm09]QEM67702.1 hypothetical protein FO488_05735 [Geobacter sp. FeAm09]